MKSSSLTAILIASILMLSACATPAEMRTRTPAQTHSSVADAKTVAVCIADRWENSGIAGATVPVNMRPTMGGFTVSFVNPASGQTQLLADVDETPKGSATHYFKHMVLGEAAFDAAVTACQNEKPSLK